VAIKGMFYSELKARSFYSEVERGFCMVSTTTPPRSRESRRHRTFSLSLRRPISGRPSGSDLYASRLIWVDVVAVLCAAAGVHMVHVESMTSELGEKPLNARYVGVTLITAMVWLTVLSWGGSRDAKTIGHGPQEYRRVVRASLTLWGTLAGTMYVFALNVPRSYLVVMMPAGVVALLIGRFLSRRWLHRQRTRGEMMSDVVVVGSPDGVKALLLDLARAPHAGYRVVGVCVNQSQVVHSSIRPDALGLPTLAGVPVLGGLDDVVEAVVRSGAHSVAVTSSDAFGPAKVRRLSWALENSNIELILAPALTSIADARIHTHPVGGLPLIHIDQPNYRAANGILKKSFDVVGGAILLLLCVPLGLVLALVVMTDGGPVFFCQERVGLDGTPFRILKFRSMAPNAEALLPALKRFCDEQNAERAAANDVLFKLPNDPRVTRIGKVLRRFSLDELPQLINVLKGDMSLVGPRPPLKSEVAKYSDEAMRRLLVKPGMTGLWQISGRSELSWEETVRLDLYYVENYSIACDLVILWKTAKAVIASSGAF